MVQIGSDNGLAPVRRQAIIWINGSLIYRRIEASLGLNELIPCFTTIRPCDQTRVAIHDDVIKWKHFPRNWSFVWGIHRSPVNSPHKGQWRGALMFSLIYAWINDWVNNREAGDLRRHRGQYDVIVMCIHRDKWSFKCVQVVDALWYRNIYWNTIKAVSKKLHLRHLLG